MEETIIDPSCPIGWIQKEHIGYGAFSDIWKACCGDNCNFVLKRNRTGEITDLKREVVNQTKCANAGLCPKVYYSSETEFIMDRLDLTVSDLFERYWDPNVNGLIVKSLFDLLDRLHQIGLIHGDLHLDNIMVKDENPELERFNEEHNIPMSELERYNHHNYRYYFIDLSDQELPPNTSPEDNIFFYDWEHLVNSLPVISRPYLKPIISEKINQLVKPSFVDPDTGVTNFMIMAINPVAGPDFFEFLLEHISPEVINLQDHEGNTVLHHLAAHPLGYKTPLYRRLIKAGANPKIRNHGGFLPVDYERDEDDKKFLEGF